MSRFYGSIDVPGKTAVTRGGSRLSGLSGHLRGWNCGVFVEVTDDCGKDKFTIYKTGGSNSKSDKVLIMEFHDGDVF